MLIQANILVVDDSATTRKLLQLLFDDTYSIYYRMNVTAVSSLQEALVQIANTKFDLIITDLPLKDTDGFSTFRAIKKAASDVPVMILSGLDDQGTIYKSISSGAVNYAVKGLCDSQMLLRHVLIELTRDRYNKQLLPVAE